MTGFKDGDKVLVEAIFCKSELKNGNDFVRIKDEHTNDYYLVPVRRDAVHPFRTYEDGMNEVWDFVTTVALTCAECRSHCDRILEDIFGTADLFEIFENYTAVDAIERFKEWEDEAKFNVGDVVTTGNRDGTIVVTYDVIDQDGVTGETCMEFEISKSLKIGWCQAIELFEKLIAGAETLKCRTYIAGSIKDIRLRSESI